MKKSLAFGTLPENSSSLLKNFSVLEFGTIDEICETVSKTYCKHSLQQHSKTSFGGAKYHRVSFGTMSFNYLRYGAEVTVNPDCFENFFLVELPLSGRSIVHYDGESVISENFLGAVVSAQGVVKSEWGRDAARLMIQIDRKYLERYATNLLGRTLNHPLEFQLPLDTRTGICAGLRAYAFHVAEQLTLNPYLLNYSLAKRQVEDTLLTMLLCGQPNNYSTEIAAVSQPGAPSYISRTYNFINDNFREEITIDDLVRVANVPMRTLYTGFKRYKGVSPMLALKTRRLEAVRADLLDPKSDYSVTEVAFRWGFTHLGNFASDYRKLYGELPSKTVRRLQDS